MGAYEIARSEHNLMFNAFKYGEATTLLPTMDHYTPDIYNRHLSITNTLGHHPIHNKHSRIICPLTDSIAATSTLNPDASQHIYPQSSATDTYIPCVNSSPTPFKLPDY